ncbi:sensor histidine kinase [Nocardia niigatensis]|uniref:sensor histidine kinase n=1 Tax=Nocardia niigatensis TaxID=209249 RepID=UPI000A0510E3|nr:ATP-binding protein [Nocardia niigatensis]
MATEASAALAAQAAPTVTASALAEAGAEGPAEARVVRLFAQFVAAGYAGYLGLLTPSIRTQMHAVAMWWTITAVVLVFAPAAVMGALSFRDSTVRIRRAAGATAWGYIAAALTWWLGWNDVLLQNDLWISVIPGLTGLAAAIAWRPLWAVLALVTAVVSVQLINHFCRAPGHNGLFVPDLAFALTFCLLYVAAEVMAIRTGRKLDDARDHAYALTAAAAEIRARDVQRKWFEALIHDSMLSPLVAVLRETPREGIRVKARQVIDQITSGPHNGPESYTGSEVVAHLRTAVTAEDASAMVDVELESDAATLDFPSSPVEVLGAAVGQAVRNSVLHAGAGAIRQIAIRVGARRVAAVVADDGVGFNPQKVPPNRLGLRVSIIGRIEELPGGTVKVRSKPGEGTVVMMAWQAA